MAEITPDMTFRTVDGLELNRVPDGAVLYQNERERVHFLNPTALVVFELCSLGKSTGEIDTFIADAFDLPDAPTAAVHECLASLVDEGLVVCVPSSAAP